MASSNRRRGEGAVSGRRGGKGRKGGRRRTRPGMSGRGRGRRARQAYFSAMRPRRGRWADDSGGGEGSCNSDEDCPSSDPTCSEYGEN